MCLQMVVMGVWWIFKTQTLCMQILRGIPRQFVRISDTNMHTIWCTWAKGKQKWRFHSFALIYIYKWYYRQLNTTRTPMLQALFIFLGTFGSQTTPKSSIIAQTWCLGPFELIFGTFLRFFLPFWSFFAAFGWFFYLIGEIFEREWETLFGRKGRGPPYSDLRPTMDVGTASNSTWRTWVVTHPTTIRAHTAWLQWSNGSWYV
jgi:hypothetical protein